MIHVDIYHGNLNEKLIAQGTTLAKETVDPHMFARLKKAGLRFLDEHNSAYIFYRGHQLNPKLINLLNIFTTNFTTDWSCSMGYRLRKRGEIVSFHFLHQQQFFAFVIFLDSYLKTPLSYFDDLLGSPKPIIIPKYFLFPKYNINPQVPAVYSSVPFAMCWIDWVRKGIMTSQTLRMIIWKEYMLG